MPVQESVKGVIPLQDVEHSENEHQACNYVVELTEMHLKHVPQCSET